MLLSPGGHQSEDGSKAFAMFRERILDARRDLRVNLAPYDVVALQFSQLLGQHLFCGCRQKPLELAEPANSTLQVEQNGRLPFSTDDVGGNGNRAIERVHCGSLPTLGTKKVPTGKKDTLA